MPRTRQSSPRRNNERIEFLTQQEINEIKQRDPEHFGEIMEAYRTYMEVEGNLNNLEARIDQSFEERYNFLKDLAERRRTTLGESLSQGREVVEQTAGNAEERYRQERETLTNSFKQELGKQWYGSFALGLFDMISNAEAIKDEPLSFDNFFTKAGGAIGKVIFELFNFGEYKNFKEAFSKIGTSIGGVIDRAGEGIGRIPEVLGIGNTPAESQTPQETPSSSQRLPESLTPTNPETARRIYFRTGAKFLISMDAFNYERLQPGVATECLSSIKAKTLEEIKSLNIEQINKISEENNVDVDSLNLVITSLMSKDVEIMIKYGLKHKTLENLFKRNKNIVKYIEGGQERLDEILKIAKKEPDNFYLKLKIEEIGILYTFTTGIIGLGFLPSLKFGEIKEELIQFVGGMGEDFEGIINDLLEDNIIPPLLLKSFSDAYIDNTEAIHLGGKSKIPHEKNGETIREVSTEINKTDRTDEEKLRAIETLKDIVSFKDFLIGYGEKSGKRKFLDYKQFGLDDRQKELFLKNLDYRWVMILYSTMSGDRDMNNLSTLPMIVLTISNIIGIGNEREKSRYIGKFGLNTILPYTQERSYLNEEENEVFKVLEWRIVLELWLKKMNEIEKLLGCIEGATGANGTILGLALLGGSVKFLSKSIKLLNSGKGLARYAGFLGTKTGLIGVVVGSLFTGVSIVSSDYFAPGSPLIDIEKAIRTRDIQLLMSIPEKLKKSIKVYDTPKGQLVFLGYNEDEKENTPWIMYDNRIWEIGICKGRETGGFDIIPWFLTIPGSSNWFNFFRRDEKDRIPGSDLDQRNISLLTFDIVPDMNSEIMRVDGKYIDFTKSRVEVKTIDGVEVGVMIFGKGKRTIEIPLDGFKLDTRNLREISTSSPMSDAIMGVYGGVNYLVNGGEDTFLSKFLDANIGDRKAIILQQVPDNSDKYIVMQEKSRIPKE